MTYLPQDGRSDGFDPRHGVWRRGLLKGLGALPLLQALAPASASAQEKPRRGGVLKLAAAYSPQSLDPLTGGPRARPHLLYPLFDTLVEFEPRTLAARPGLATSWDYPDPKTLVFTLREGIRFHDGTAFDAAAVKFNLDRALNDERSSVRGDLQSLQSIEVLASNKVALHLNRPDTALPLILADRSGMMSSPKAVGEKGKMYDRGPVGTGPFRFVRWDDGDVIEVVRNENYWKPACPGWTG